MHAAKAWLTDLSNAVPSYLNEAHLADLIVDKIEGMIIDHATTLKSATQSMHACREERL